MAKGNNIIVSANPRGVFMEGIVKTGETPYPGQIVQIDISEATVGGRHTFEIYNADADGGNPKGAYFVVLEDALQGKTAEDAYAAGERIFVYTPVAGEELNLRWDDTDTGTTTNDLTKGTVGIIQDTTGNIIATAGSPEDEVCMLLEDLSNLDGDTLGWSIWQGK